MRSSILVLSMLFLSVSFGHAQPPRTVRVSGKGQANVRVRKASLRLTFRSRAANQQQAEAKNAGKVNAAKALLKEGVAGKLKISTDTVSLREQYEGPWQTRKLIGYEVTQTLSVEASNKPEVLGGLFRVAGQAKTDSIWGPRAEPTARQIASAERKAAAAAIRNAAKEAMSLASVVGDRLGRVLNISTAPQNSPNMPRRARSFGAETAAASPPVSDIEMKMPKVFSKVDVEFELHRSY
jgi:uncharacterized protein YggE